MMSNQSLNTISDSIEALSQYATNLAEQYVIDSPAVCLDKMDQTYVRVGRHKSGRSLLYATKGGVEELLTAAPIRAKVSFMDIFEAFFATYADHATRFWQDVDQAILKCKDCVPAARAAVQKAEDRVQEDSHGR